MGQFSQLQLFAILCCPVSCSTQNKSDSALVPLLPNSGISDSDDGIVIRIDNETPPVLIDLYRDGEIRVEGQVVSVRELRNFILGWEKTGRVMSVGIDRTGVGPHGLGGVVFAKSTEQALQLIGSARLSTINRLFPSKRS